MRSQPELEALYREYMNAGALPEALYLQELLAQKDFDLAALGPSPAEARDAIDRFPYYVEERDYQRADQALRTIDELFPQFRDELDRHALESISVARDLVQSAHEEQSRGDLPVALDAFARLLELGWLKGDLLLERNRLQAEIDLTALEQKADLPKLEGAVEWTPDMVALLCKVYADVERVNTWQSQQLSTGRESLLARLSQSATRGLLSQATALLKRDSFEKALGLLAQFEGQSAIDRGHLSSHCDCAEKGPAFRQHMGVAEGHRQARRYADEQAALREARSCNPWSEQVEKRLELAHQRDVQADRLRSALLASSEQCRENYGSHRFREALAAAKRYLELSRSNDAAELLPHEEVRTLQTNGREMTKRCRTRRVVHYATGEFLIDRILGK